MSPPVRPEPDESTLSDADLWEAKVAQGMPKDSATAYVQNRQRATPTTTADAEAFTRGGGSSFGAPTGGVTDALLAGTAQGASFGFADELAGAALNKLGSSTTAQDLRDYSRGAQTAHPKTFLAGEIAGAVMSPLTRVLSRGAPATTLGGRVMQGARIGATGGAIAGAGTANPGQRGTGALLGGGAGLVFGGAAPVAGAVGGLILDAMGRRPQTAARVAQEVAASRPPLQPRAGTGGVTGGARAGNVDFSPLARGAAGLAETLGPRTMDDVTSEVLLNTMNKAGVTLPDAVATAQAAQAAGSPLTFADVMGAPGTRIAQAARGVSGRAAGTIGEALETRHGGQTERILGAAERGLGQSRGNIFETADEIAQRRGANAAREYAEAYNAPPINPSVKVDPKAGDGSATLLDLFKRPSMQKALERARTIAAEDGEQLPPLTKTVKQTVQRDGKMVEETVEEPIPVSVKTLHYVKLALDDMVFGGKRGQPVLGESSGGTGPTALAKIQQTRHALLDVMDREAPSYGKARANFAGETALKDALENGREAIGKKLDPRLIQREFSGLSDSEKEMYRRGAIDALQHRMESPGSGANKVLRVFDSPEDKSRLRALFPDDASFDAFTEQMGREAQMAQTRNAVLKGSQTAEKTAAQQELEDDGLEAIAQNAASPKAALLRASLNAIGNRRRVQTRAVADALAPRIVQGATPTGGTLMDLLTGLTEAEKRLARRAAERRAITAASGAAVGSSAGGP